MIRRLLKLALTRTGPHLRPPPRTAPARACAEAVEPRVLYSADPFGAQDHWVGEAEVRVLDLPAAPKAETPDDLAVTERAAETTRETAHEATRETSNATPEPLRIVAFIDAAMADVPGWDTALPAEAERIQLNNRADGVQQIAQVLQGRQGLDAIHLISRGGAGQLQLGNRTVDERAMTEQDADAWARIGQALQPGGDLLVYGGGFAAGEIGHRAAQTLAELTGAQLSASTETLADFNGDWQLAFSTAPFEAKAWAAATTGSNDAASEALIAKRELVFVDSAVANADTLLEALLLERGTGPVVDVVTIGLEDDGLAVITQALASEQGVTAIHIVSHGDDGVLLLGNARVDAASLLQRQAEIQGWNQALSAQADLLLWGCEVGAGDIGQAFVAELAALTGADVAASTNITGSAERGGDWALELRTGEVEAPLLQNTVALDNYAGTLALSVTGSETRINSNTTGNQTSNSFGRGNVAMDANGNFVAVYTDNNANSGDVMVRRFDATGAPLAAAFTANTTTTNTQEWAGVAMSSSGAFVVTWTSYDQDAAGTYGVYARLYNASGAAITGEILVNNGLTADNQYFPQAAMADDGSFAVVFQNAGAGLGDIVIKRYNASGTLQTTTTLSNAATENYASMAMNASGMFAVAWERDGTDGSGFGIYARLYNAAGTQIGSEVLVNTTTANFQRNPSIGIDASGNFAVAWNSYAQDTGTSWGVYARRFSNTATALGTEFAVNTTTANDQITPSLTMASDGRFLVVWQSDLQDGDGLGIYGREYAADGTAAGAETRINTTTTGAQQYASASFVGNRAVVTWSGNGPGDADGVFFQLLNSPGLVTSASGGLVTTEAGGQASFTVQLATAPTANVTVAVTSTDATEGTVSPSSLTFTPANWNVAQTVTVTGVDDALGDGNVAYQVQLGSITSADPAYNGMAAATVGVTNTDNEAVQSIVVSTLADTLGGDTSSLTALAASRGPDGLISLREALLAANNTNNGGIAHQITFSVAGTINLGSALPSIARAISINGTNAAAPGITLNGGGTVGTGLELNTGADNSTVRGLVLRSFVDFGMRVVNATNVTIAGNYVGTNSAGTSASGNAIGIDLYNAVGAVVGGSTAADRNIISGNSNIGLNIVGPTTGSTQNIQVHGNYIGTTVTGSVDLGNTWHGIYVHNASGVTIGGASAGMGNVISGQGIAAGGNGLTLSTGAEYNFVYGNIIGLNAAGTAALGNTGDGIEINGANNIIGGASSALRNVISGNAILGVQISGAAAHHNVVQGNYIGTNAAGTADLGNAEDGLQIDTGASNNTVGGTTSGAGNIVAGNNNSGIAVDDAASANNALYGNWLGIGSNGTTVLANSHNGISVLAATGTLIGDGTTAGRNVITNSGLSGINLNNATGTRIKGNWIIDNSGGDGITVGGSSSGTVIGGETASSGNLIAYNSTDGIVVTSSAASAATILSNNIYSNGQRGIDLGDNGYTGNDGGDVDTGPNNYQNYPVLTTATASTTGTNIVGSLNTTAAQTFRIDFYTNRPGNTDGTNGEGERWLGFTTVTTDGSGYASINATLNDVWINYNDRVTATATRDLGSGNYGATSEFAVNITGQANGVLVVDTLSDTSDGTTTSISNLGNARGADGKISLREAITAANNTANGGSADRIVFAIPPNIESGNLNTALQSPTISVASNLPAITQALNIDGTTQTGYSGTPLVRLDASGAVTYGLRLNAGSANSTVRGLIVTGFTTAGISVNSSNTNTIAGNWIGLASDGVTPDGNKDGIVVLSSTGTTIGGTNASDRNVITGNTQVGLHLDTATNSVVYGNYIGTSASGLADVDGTVADLARTGVMVSGGSGNQIGNTIAGARNVISGNNWFGLEFVSGAINNTATGNFIGTDATGLVALGNTGGGASFWGSGAGNLVGGNVISGNLSMGVLVGGAATGSAIRGNTIGLGADGSTALGNVGSGIEVGAGSTQVGTNADGSNDAAEVNTISANSEGIRVLGSGTVGTLIRGNYIGTDTSGTLDRGNLGDGIVIQSSAGATTIGGTSATTRNIISGNSGRGIAADVASVIIQGNYVGLDVTGTQDLGNDSYGIDIGVNGTNATIGGAGAGAGNIISGNGNAGVLFESGSSGSIKGNRIGTNAAGNAVIAGNGAGVFLASSGVTVGGIAAGEANTISGSNTHGVIVSSGTGNSIAGNAIYANSGLAIDLGNNSVTANDAAPDSDSGANNLQNFPVLATASTNASNQLVITGTLTSALSSFYRIHFYSSATQQAGGYGPAETYLGYADVPTNGSGIGTINTTLTANVPVGRFITATATRATDGTYTTFTDTSELARNIAAVSSTQATVTVDTVSDTSDGDTTSLSTLLANKGADGFISLREAITAANATANGTSADLINFAISGTGVHTLTPATALPQITQAVVIDATAEDSVAANGGRPAVEIFGNGLNAHGLNLSAAADGTTIKGLSISGFAQWGMVIASSSNSNTVQGNYFGLRADGNTIAANSIGGIQLNGSSNLIGGSTAAQRNVIAGNTNAGLMVLGSSNTITGNYVGTDATGMLDRGNGGVGITFDGNATGNLVGGSLAGERNVISGNNSDALYITNTATGTLVRGNYIGIAADGLTALANSGVGVRANGTGASNTIGGIVAGQGNLIANHPSYGITVSGTAAGVAILGNTLVQNTGMGIDLAMNGVSANDAGDADTGPNNLQNFPVITGAITNGSLITLNGRLNSAASSYYRLEFFSNTTGDSSGYGEGQTLLGFVNVATNAAGDASFATTFTATVPAGRFISATATRATDGTYSSFIETSEFAANVLAVDPVVPSNAVPGAQTTAEDTARVFSTGNGNAITISDSDAGGANNQITVSVTNGTLTLASTAGLSFASGDGTADASMVVRGTAAAINTALNGLSFAPTANYNGGAVLTLATKDTVLLSLDIDTALVGRYAFENTGALGTDTSPAAGNTATVNGATAVVDGTRGNVVNLDGSSSLQLAGVLGSPANVTLAAWVNLTAADAFGAEVISLGDRISLRLDQAGQMYGQHYNGSTYEGLAFTSTLAGTGWHHVAFTFDDTNNTRTLFLDGVAVASQSSSDSVNYAGATSTVIGRNGGGGTDHDFTGRIDEARIYNRALTSQEIAVLADDLAMVDTDTVAVTVTAVADTPSVNTTGSALTYTEGAAATAVDSGIVVADADGGNLASATVSISANYDSTADALLFADQNGITGSWNAATGVLSLTGSATIAQYQTALRSVSFINPSDTPSTAARTVSFVVNDGSANSNTATRNINLANVNDAPTYQSGTGVATTGFTATSTDFINGTALQADGKIVVVGYSHDGARDIALARYNADGSLDLSFGSGTGKVITNLGGDEIGQAVQVLGSGQIVVAASADGDFALLRYNADGSLDTSFGGGDGWVKQNVSGFDDAYALAVQADGKLLVAGRTGNDFGVARFLSDGTLDTGFGSGGSTLVDFGTASDSLYDMVLQADGKIVLGGAALNGVSVDAALARLTSTGALDTSFNGTGKLMVDIGTNSADTGYAVTQQADGKLVLAGWSDAAGTTDFFAIRVNTNGTLDTSFSGDGKVTQNFGGSSDLGLGVVAQADGKIIVAGQANPSSNNISAVRYNSDGTVDAGYGTAGIVNLDIGTNTDDRGHTAMLQRDGKLLIAGTSNAAGTADFALVRLTSNGSLDTQFNLTTNTLGGSVAHTEGGSATVLDSNVKIFDAELNASGNYSGATLTLQRNGGANAQDAYSSTGTLVTLNAGANNLVVDGVTIGSVTTNAGGTLVLSFNASATAALVNSAAQKIAYSNSSDTPPASVQIDWVFSDGNSGSQGTGGAQLASGNVVVNITATNDAPVLTDTALSASVAEDMGLVIRVADLLGGASDAEGNPLGFALTAADSSQGTWSYSLNAGGNWTSVGTVNSAQSLLLPSDGNNALLYFAPTGNWNGSLPAALTIRAWDQTSGTAGSKVSTTTNGGSTAFSGATDFVQVTVTAVNDAPSFTGLDGTPSYTEGAAAAVLDSNVALFDIELNASNYNGATLTLQRNGGANAQDVYSATGTLVTLNAGANNLVVDGVTIGSVTTNSGGSLVLSFNTNATTALVTSAAQKIAYSNSSDAPPASVQINWVFADGNAGGQGSGGALSASGSATVAITPVNDAPTLLNGSALSLSDTDEDTASFPVAVSTLLGAASHADPDAGAVQGLAVTGVTGTGTWQYSTDGSTWTNVGTVSATQALLLSDSSSLRYVPNGVNAETASFSFRAWDTTSGAASAFGAPITANPGAGGGTSAYSTGSATASRNVIEVNDAPVLDASKSPVLVAVQEASGTPSGAVGTLVSSLIDFASPAGQMDNVSDVDAGAQTGIAVVGADTSQGNWWYSTDNGGNWLAMGAVSDASARLLAADGSTRVYFQPTFGYTGTLASGLSLRAWDRSSGSNGAVVDASTNGGATAYSALTDTAAISVTVAPQRIVSGSFVGNGTDNRSFAGLGFTPEVVIILDQTGTQVGVIRNSAMAGDAAKPMSGSTALAANLVQSLDADGFTLGNDPRTNKTGDTYQWVAFGANPHLHVGTYTGNGGSLTITGLSFQPELVFTLAANSGEARWNTSLATIESNTFDSGAPGTLGIQSFTSDGYTLGGGPSMNSAGVSYTFVAFDQHSAYFNQASYTGDGVDNRNITGVGFESELLLVRQLGGSNTPMLKTGSTGAADVGLRANGSGSQSNTLQNIGADGFQLGNDSKVNGSGQTYGWMAFNGTTYSVNQAPVITNDGGDATAAVTSYENSTVVTTVTGADADMPVQTLTFSITGGADAAKFSINSSSGVLSFLAAPNAEAPTDVGGDNVYDVVVEVSDGVGGVDAQTIAVTVANVNEVPAGSNGTVSTAEDTDLVFNAAQFGFSDLLDSPPNSFDSVRVSTLPASGTLRLNGVDVLAGQVVSVADINAGLLSYSPAANLNGTAVANFSFQVRDNGGTANGGVDEDASVNTLSIDVTAVNDAPVLADIALMLTVAEDAGAPSGTVGSLLSTFTGGISDIDAGAVKGIAITATNETNGTWHYSTDAGSTWNPVGAVSDASSLLLADTAGTRLYFAPNTNFNGIVASALTLRAWDQTSGAAGNKVNTSSNGGITAFSSATDVIDVAVTAVNDAPTAAAASASGAEDAASIAITLSGSDLDGTVTQFRLDTLPVHGSLYTDAALTTLAATGTDYAATSQALTLYFVPAADWNGVDSFDYQARDDAGQLSLSAATATLTVNAVNDAPLNTVPGVQITPVNTTLVLSGTSAISVADVDAAVLEMSLSVTNGTITLASTAGLSFSTGDGSADAAMVFSGSAAAINTALDGLSYAPTGGYNGAATLSLTTSDLGATGSGGTLTDTDTVPIQVGAARFQEGVAGFAGFEDTYVEGASPGTDHGNDSTVAADDSNSGDAALLRFGNLFGSGPGQIAWGSTIDSASFSIYITNGDAFSTLGIYSMFGAWAEGSTYSSLVGGVQADNSEAGAAALTTFDGGRTGWLNFIGAASIVQGWANGGTNNGFAFMTGDANDWAFASSEYATVSLRPYMTINYTPPQPANVTASGGSATFTENGTAVVVDSGLTLTDADSSQLTGASVSISSGYISGQDLLNFTDQSGITGSWNGGTGVLTLSGTATVTQYQDALRSITYGNSSESLVSASRTVSFHVQDTWVAGGTDTRTVNVVAVNDAPTLTNGAVVALASTDEDTPSAGTLVSAILTGAGWGDVDGPASKGIAITAATGNGTWQYSTDGSTWVNIGAVTASNALLLDSGSQVRYQPDGLNPETAAFDFVAWDKSTGSASTNGSPIYAAPGAGGGSSAYSAQAASSTLTVSAVNDAPVVTAASLTLNEGETRTLAPANFAVADPDNASFTFTVSGVSGGFFQLSNAAGTPITNFTTADVAGGLVQFVDDGNEVAPAFSITASDGALSSNTLAASISYTPVNDAPVVNTVSLTLGEGDTVTLAPADITTTDPDSVNLSFTISALSGGYFQLSSAAGTPITTFTSAQLAGGAVQFVDDGNELPPAFSVTASDGALSSNTLGASISYTPVNDAPVLAAASLTLNEGETVTLAPANFTVNDPDSTSFGITVSGLSGGYFQLSTAAGTPITSFTSADLAAGLVQFVDDGNEVAPAFSVIASDGALSSNTLAASISYTPANDAPVVNAVSLILNEGQTVTLAPAHIATTDPDNASFSFTVSALTGGYFRLSSAAGTPISTFTSAELAGGMVQFVDDGDEAPPAFNITASDGALASNTLPASIGYTPINDAPVLDSSSPYTFVSITEDDVNNGGQTVASLLASAGSPAISDADLGAVQGIAVNASNPGNGRWQYSLDGGSSWLNLAAVSDSAALLLRSSDQLRFVPDAVQATTASISFRAWDRSTGAAGARVDVGTPGGTSAFSTATAQGELLVSAVNDVPTTSTVVQNAIQEDVGARLIGQTELLAWAQDIDGDALQAVNLRIISGPGSLLDNGDGTWTYLTAQDANGVVTFGYEITDATVQIAGNAQLQVVAVNDQPVTSPVVLAGIAEDSGPRTITQAELLSQAGDADADPLVATGLQISAGAGSLVDNADGTWTYTPALNDNGRISFSFQITDGLLSTAASASLELTPVNDAPALQWADQTGSVRLDRDENAAAIGAATASDVDHAVQSLRFSLAGGADAALFTLDSVTGELKFVAAPDFENPVDANRDGVYDVSLRVEDDTGARDELALRVRVSDINDAPVLNMPASINYQVQPQPGQVVATVGGSDQDAGDQVRFALLDDAGGRFVIDPTSGEVRFTGLAPAASGGGSTHTLVVQLTDTNGSRQARTLALVIPGAASTEDAAPAAGSGNAGTTPSTDTTVVVKTTDAVASNETQITTVWAAPELMGEDEARNGRERMANLLREVNGGADAGTALLGKDASTRNMRVEIAAPTSAEAAANTSVVEAVAAWMGDANSGDSSVQRIADLMGRQWGSGRRSGEDGLEEEDNALASGKPKNTTQQMDELLLQFTKAEHVASVGFSVGLVWWLTRGGGLLASAMMGAPAWKQVDLLTIMTARDDDERAEDDDGDDDDESEEVKDLFGKNSSAGPA